MYQLTNLLSIYLPAYPIQSNSIQLNRVESINQSISENIDRKMVDSPSTAIASLSPPAPFLQQRRFVASGLPPKEERIAGAGGSHSLTSTFSISSSLSELAPVWDKVTLFSLQPGQNHRQRRYEL